MKIAELIIAIENGRAAHNSHENYVSGNILSFEAITRITPSMTLPQVHGRLALRHKWITRTGSSSIDTKHASCEGYQCYYHFPWM